jgi:hypothetical protein
MMFERIREGMAKMEYGCNLQSLIVFVPVASLIALKVQRSYLLNESQKAKYATPQQLLAVFGRLNTPACYHIVGSSIQTITLLALTTLLHPLFLAPCFFSLYEMLSSICQLSSTNMKIQIDQESYSILNIS